MRRLIQCGYYMVHAVVMLIHPFDESLEENTAVSTIDNAVAAYDWAFSFLSVYQNFHFV